ncbi:MAG TPA: TetR/AcrR family transcriptional regulator [Mycobacteriales bacterium]|nr:TetR/AcrR family transcriptional regulator [Mycobacteriales bacterium]
MTAPGTGPAPGGRSRAGNTMARTRASVLSGARQCVLRYGSRKTTMVDIAATAGVAKATLYNHFRAKSEVYAALVDAEVARAVTETLDLGAQQGPAAALTRLADELAGHAVVRHLATNEPGVLAQLVVPSDPPAAPWGAARQAIASLLAPQGGAPEPAVELVLRWLVSQLLWSGSRAENAWTAPALVAAAGGPRDTVDVRTPAGTAADTASAAPPGNGHDPAHATVPGLGFPGDPVRVSDDLATVD